MYRGRAPYPFSVALRTSVDVCGYAIRGRHRTILAIVPHWDVLWTIPYPSSVALRTPVDVCEFAIRGRHRKVLAMVLHRDVSWTYPLPVLCSIAYVRRRAIRGRYRTILAIVLHREVLRTYPHPFPVALCRSVDVCECAIRGRHRDV